MSKPPRNYYEASARQRIEGLLDPGSFTEILPPGVGPVSPHLHYFKLPVAFDDGVVVGEGRFEGKEVAVIAQEGRFMGGAIGEVHSGKIVGLLHRAIDRQRRAVLFLFDSGGVRLQEANAGEIGVAEIIRALLDVRAAGIPVAGIVGGSCGAYGGGGLISGCCDFLIVSEEGRIGVSGPEVIESNMGVEVFDARDRALIWRTYGGKNRYLQGQADELVENSIPDFRAALAAQLPERSDYSLERLKRQQAALEARFARFGDCRDGREVWAELGIRNPHTVPDLTAAKLKAAAEKGRIEC